MAQGVLEGHPSSDGALILSINGSLDTTSTGQAWRRALQLITEHQPKGLIVDASHLTYCDGAGAALLLELRRRQESRRQPYEIQSLDPIGFGPNTWVAQPSQRWARGSTHLFPFNLRGLTNAPRP